MVKSFGVPDMFFAIIVSLLSWSVGEDQDKPESPLPVRVTVFPP